MRERVLVTGASGFIGKNLAAELVSRGYAVRCLIRPSSDRSFLETLGVSFAEGDLLDPPSLLRALDGISTVYHLAATVRPEAALYRRDGFAHACFSVNVDGSGNLAAACAAKGVRKLVHYSSVASSGPGTAVKETDDPRPFSTYGRSKLAGEKRVLSLCREAGLHVVVIRPGMVYGPHSTAWLPLFRLVSAGLSLSIKDTEVTPPVCYVGNLVEATMLLAEKGEAGGIYFMADESRPFDRTVHLVSDALGRRRGPRNIAVPRGLLSAGLAVKETVESAIGAELFPFRIVFNSELLSAMPLRWGCDTSRLDNLGYLRRFGAEEGIRLTADWFRLNGFL